MQSNILEQIIAFKQTDVWPASSIENVKLMNECFLEILEDGNNKVETNTETEDEGDRNRVKLERNPERA